jgi:simple sugar transport system ATP-binding protein
VEGNGQSELLQLLLHPKDYSHDLKGTVKVLGKDTHSLHTDQIKSLGMGVIPDDRLRDALLLDRPVSENFILGLQRREPFNHNGIISDSELEKATWQAIDEYDVRPRSASVKIGGLSGGNQQKVVIAREFKYSPQFLIAAQPTRGVDVGAIEFIHKRILKARSEGCGVLLISSELDEILALSDRILVMYEGSIVAEFSRGEVSEKVLGLRMGGAVSL